MSNIDIIRAWKDEEYKLSLSESERAMLPENPAGFIELTDADLDIAAGGSSEVSWGYTVSELRQSPINRNIGW